MHRKFRIAVLVFTFLPAFLIAEELPKDAESNVPELTAFHEVIYPIWHTAFPAKDAAALRSYLKEVNAGFARIEKARLPGILHEKQTAWDKGLAELKGAVAGYNQAAGAKDDAALLKAAEDLHSRYEQMVRIIRPVLKEMDAFHRVLYVVFHTYLPGKSWDKIAAASTDLQTKAEAIAKAKLPQRLEARTPAFQKAAESLLAECRKLPEATRGNDPVASEKGVNAVHTAYQALEKVFE